MIGSFFDLSGVGFSMRVYISKKVKGLSLTTCRLRNKSCFENGIREIKDLDDLVSVSLRFGKDQEVIEQKEVEIGFEFSSRGRLAFVNKFSGGGMQTDW